MSIRVKYFAVMSDKMGRNSDEVEYVEGLTVADIWNQLSQDIEGTTAYLSAVNMEYSGEDTVVKDGDEVAFFPKVSGG